MRIGAEIRADVRVNGEPIGGASPQDALFNDIVNEVATDSLYISKVDKIVLVDSGGTERDSTTTLDYTDRTTESPPKVEIHGTIDITADYTVAKIRLYAGTKLYFETSWSRAVQNGDKVDVTVTVQVSGSGSVSGTTTGSLAGAGFAIHICKALIGASEREQIGFARAVLLTADNVELYNQPLSRTADTANNQATGDTGMQSPSAEGDAVTLQFRNSGGYAVAVFSLDTAVSITTETQVRVQFTFSVS
ncbi:MAG: hypothetical protein DRJ96_02855 [Thermoprotei archaeon]|nr:MAG: hypothetical protein DRJ96_02855 [Thermoprotei archaeon]